MKTAADIASKIRQVRFEYLKAAYQSDLSRRPCNCIYNRTATLHGEGEVVTRLCGFYSDDKNYIVCDTIESAQKCDAFVCRKTKKQVREYLEKDMIENTQKYPEILVLEWVLGKKNPTVLNNTRITWGKMKIWFGSFFKTTLFKLKKYTEKK
jgi:hypothetical protein